MATETLDDGLNDELAEFDLSFVQKSFFLCNLLKIKTLFLN